MTMVQQNFHFSTQAQYPSSDFVTAQEIQNTTNNKKKQRRNLDPGAFRPRVIKLIRIETLTQEDATVACTRDFVAKFSCKRSKLLQPISRIFNALRCGAIKL